MSQLLTYFAYGSNLSSRRLRERSPTADPVGVATLHGWSLRFDKRGRDGTAKANIVPEPGARVMGVLYTLEGPDRRGLDVAEGLGRAYAEHWVEVACPNAATHPVLCEGVDVLRWRAFTYVAIDVLPGLPVAPWYLAHMLTGAAEHDLPPEYVEWMRELARS